MWAGCAPRARAAPAATSPVYCRPTRAPLAVSSEIRALQEQSLSLSVRMANRKALDAKLTTFLHKVSVPEALITRVVEGAIDESWMRDLDALAEKLTYAQSGGAGGGAHDDDAPLYGWRVVRGGGLRSLAGELGDLFVHFEVELPPSWSAAPTLADVPARHTADPEPATAPLAVPTHGELEACARALPNVPSSA